MKYEWRKREKELYGPTTTPSLISVPEQSYLMISGSGNPNSSTFGEQVEALYSLSYAIRMMPKSGHAPEGYFEYTVFPLEGVWDLSEVGRKLATLDKDELVYRIMIRQPEFVTKEVFERALEKTLAKKPNQHLKSVTLHKETDGLCVHCMHIGSYDSEPETFARMEAFASDAGYQRIDKTHREIYLSDPRKSSPESLKTILRARLIPV